jgi:hypothetical protein
VYPEFNPHRGQNLVPPRLVATYSKPTSCVRLEKFTQNVIGGGALLGTIFAPSRFPIMKTAGSPIVMRAGVTVDGPGIGTFASGMSGGKGEFESSAILSSIIDNPGRLNEAILADTGDGGTG